MLYLLGHAVVGDAVLLSPHTCGQSRPAGRGRSVLFAVLALLSAGVRIIDAGVFAFEHLCDAAVKGRGVVSAYLVGRIEDVDQSVRSATVKADKRDLFGGIAVGQRRVEEVAHELSYLGLSDRLFGVVRPKTVFRKIREIVGVTVASGETAESQSGYRMINAAVKSRFFIITSIAQLRAVTYMIDLFESMSTPNGLAFFVARSLSLSFNGSKIREMSSFYTILKTPLRHVK